MDLVTPTQNRWWDLRPFNSYPGRELLGAQWRAGREQIETMLEGCYQNIGGQPVLNYGLWLKARRDILGAIGANFQRCGLEMAPLWEWAFEDRAAPHSRPADRAQHVDLVRAMTTDAGPRFWRHIAYRHATDGNVHVEWTGHTGTAKSSCAINMADWTRELVLGERIDPARIEEYVNFDLADLPKKMRNKKPGETVIQDEYVALSGEGARTHQAQFQNMEDTIRKGGVDLYVCTPRGRKDQGTMQARLESIAWNPKQKWTLFLAWVEDSPKGCLAVPWCRKELYDAYSTWKDKNVDRALAGNFTDDKYLAKMAMRMFDNRKVQTYLAEIVKSPKMTYFSNAVKWWSPDGMLTVSQRDNVAELMQSWVVGYEHLHDKIEDLWEGITPNDGYVRVAQAINRKTTKEE